MTGADFYALCSDALLCATRKCIKSLKLCEFLTLTIMLIKSEMVLLNYMLVPIIISNI